MGRNTDNKGQKLGPTKFPKGFSWIAVQFEDLGTSFPINTKKSDIFRNFEEETLSVEILYEKWYPSKIIARGGKKFPKFIHFQKF